MNECLSPSSIVETGVECKGVQGNRFPLAAQEVVDRSPFIQSRGIPIRALVDEGLDTPEGSGGFCVISLGPKLLHTAFPVVHHAPILPWRHNLLCDRKAVLHRSHTPLNCLIVRFAS